MERNLYLYLFFWETTITPDYYVSVMVEKEKKEKQEMLQYVTNAPQRSLIMTLIPGCDLEHNFRHNLTSDMIVTLTLGVGT